ncbi:MAG TPA: ion channel [Candidatus Acidoferrales bacterium]|nr:ion channel [Candidatus Acidoferrales bacterium]
MLVSLLLFLMLSPFLERDLLGEVILAVLMYLTLVAALLKLSEKRSARLPGILLASSAMLVTLAGILHPLHYLLIADWMLLALFFGFVCVTLFAYLGRPGAITRGQLLASVSLYLLLGVFYYAVFNLIEVLHHGSFVEAGLPASASISRHSLLYLSLITLTTLGYGDVVPVSPTARTMAALEAMTGVLYIAITVARLVAAYQKTGSENS